MRKARIYRHTTKSTPWLVCYYDETGKRRKKSFASKVEAEKFADGLNELAHLPDELQFSTSERIEFARIRAKCAELGVPLSAAHELIANAAASLNVARYGWEDSVSAFLEDTAKRGARPTTITFYRVRLARFFNAERPEAVSDITTKRAESYLSAVKSPEHAKRALRAFYSFCVARGWAASNPFLTAKTPRRIAEKELPHVLSVPDTKRLLGAISDEWRPAFALMAFCGVRPGEIISTDKIGLKIGSIDFKRRKITIPPDVAKTRATRIFEPPANVWAWLNALKGRSPAEPIAPASYELYRKQKEICGVELPHDILRHSFASYGYHHLGAEHTVEIMGHVGGFGVFAKHYKGLADRASASEYFSITPDCI